MIISALKKITVSASALVLSSATFVAAEELSTIFTRVNELVAAKNYPKAMEELAWAKKEIEKMHQGRIGDVLPANVIGFVGDEVQFQGALGFTNIERTYKKGEQEIKFAITGGSGEGLGGLAGLAKMGMMMGATQPGVDQFRVDGTTLTLDKKSGNGEVTAFLDSGSIVNITSVSGVDAATLKSFAEAIKFSQLDSYLKGK